jgi:lauroyl/myristoyl acyltransferase
MSRTRLLICIFNVISAAAGVIPRHEVAEPICRFAGVVWYLTVPRVRRAVRHNLRHVLGREPSRCEIVAVFQNGILNYWDTFAIAHMSHETVLELVDIHGREHLETAFAGGRGVVVASAHIGSVALVGQILPALGYKTTALLEPFDPPELYEFFARLRQSMGARLLPAGTAALRELLLALRRKEVIGLVTDRDVTGSGPMVPFFDAETQFPDGGAALSVRTGAPLVVAVCARRPDGRFDAWMEPPLSAAPTGDPKRDVLQLTRALARRLEYHIAKHPEQWTVFQQRWPEGQPG